MNFLKHFSAFVLSLIISVHAAERYGVASSDTSSLKHKKQETLTKDKLSSSYLIYDNGSSTQKVASDRIIFFLEDSIFIPYRRQNNGKVRLVTGAVINAGNKYFEDRITFKDSLKQKLYLKRIQVLSEKHKLKELHLFPEIGAIVFKTSKAILPNELLKIKKMLEKETWIKRVEFSQVVDHNLEPNDPWYSDNQKANYAPMGMEAGWSHVTSVGNNKVIIVIMDSGIDQDHTDLDDVNKFSVKADFTGTGVEDVEGHGTEMAGICCAETNNSVGIAGIMWQGNVWIYKIENSDDFSMAMQNLRDKSNPTKGGDPEYKFVILFAGGAYVDPTAFGFIWWEMGILQLEYMKAIIVAACSDSNKNMDNETQKYWPEYFSIYSWVDSFVHIQRCYKNNVIAVSGVKADDTRWESSNYGSDVTFCALAHQVLTTVNTGVYDFVNGNSVATSIITAITAMIIDNNSQLSMGQIIELIAHKCDKIGSSDTYTINADYGKKNQYFGYGRINFNNLSSAITSIRNTLPMNSVMLIKQ